MTPAQRRELQRTAGRPTTSQRMARRCRIVLLRADGITQQEVARQLGVNRPVVAHWEKRFAAHGTAGLEEARRSGRPKSLAPATEAAIISEATRPPPGCTQWSTRRVARAKGVSNHTVHKL